MADSKATQTKQTTMASCCPADRCPALGNPDEYEAKGEIGDLDGLRTYFVGTPGPRAVIVVADVFGMDSGRHKGIADTFAEEGYYVVMPDLFHGDKLSHATLGTDKTGIFMKKFAKEVIAPDFDKVYAHLAGKGVTKTAMIGFCWGSWAIFHESARGARFDCGVNCHPSLKIEKAFFGGSMEGLAKMVRQPQLMFPCQGDPEEVQPEGSVHKILTALPFGAACAYTPFPEQKHGFVSQGDLTNADTLRDVTIAITQSVDFINTHLNNKKLVGEKRKDDEEGSKAKRAKVAGLYSAALVEKLQQKRPFWHHTMLRVKDPKASIAFYRDHMGMRYIDHIQLPDKKFATYFLATVLDDVQTPEPGTDAAHEYLWSTPNTVLALTHILGTESQADFTPYNNGNVNPHRGFGHIAFNCEDVYACSAELEKADVKFQKKPDEGRMKGLAFALDPDGYWVELVQRSEGCIKQTYNLSQTMIRIKDPAASLPFYTDLFGLTLVRESHFSDFSLYFLAHVPEGTTVPDPTTPEGVEFVKTLYGPTLELTHNHGTEKQEGAVYHNGNDAPKGFGHLAFQVDDVHEFCDLLKEAKVPFQKDVRGGASEGVAIVLDPTGYWVEVVPRGVKGPEALSSLWSAWTVSETLG